MYSANALSDRQAVLHEKRRIRAHRKRIFFLILFILVLVGFFVLLRKPFLRINSVTVTGNTLTSSEEVKNFVITETSGYKMFLIPKNSILFINKQNLESMILGKFPRLSSGAIAGTRDLNIEITEPVFESMYCELDGDTSTKCALLHPDGKIGSIAPVYSYAPFFSFYKEAPMPVVGASAIDLAEIDRIRLLRQEIESYGLSIIGFVYGVEYDEVLLDTGSEFAELPRIRLMPGVVRDDIVKTLGIAAKDPNVKRILLDELYNLEYIDLRFSGQVVYKRKGE